MANPEYTILLTWQPVASHFFAIISHKFQPESIRNFRSISLRPELENEREFRIVVVLSELLRFVQYFSDICHKKAKSIDFYNEYQDFPTLATDGCRKKQAQKPLQLFQ